jgi:N4-(beta-N-acetylglucosaminyl)-L-asparaginase
MRTCGSFLIVELMRGGLSPDAACRTAVQRIVLQLLRTHTYAQLKADENLQVAFVALSKSGCVGHYAIRPGFQCNESPDFICAAPHCLSLT